MNQMADTVGVFLTRVWDGAGWGGVGLGMVRRGTTWAGTYWRWLAAPAIVDTGLGSWMSSLGRNYAPHAVAPFVFQLLHSTPGRFPVFLFKVRSYSAPCSQVKTRTLLPPCFSQGPWDQHGEGQLRPCTCSFLCQELDLLPFTLTLFHFHSQIFSTSVQFLLGFVCSVLYLEGRGNGWGKRL